ncbi:MAG: hypothetical protein ACM3XZ_02705 [Betaproteobacteria bacterium]
MPELTPNIGLKKPLGNETVSRASYNENLDIMDAAFGDRTPDQTEVPAPPGTGTLAQILSWFANRIKAITGATNWWDAPATTLAAAKAHADRTDNPHATTAAQVGAVNKAGDTMTGPLTLAGDPTAALHAATKQYVDGSIEHGSNANGEYIKYPNGDMECYGSVAVSFPSNPGAQVAQNITFPVAFIAAPPVVNGNPTKSGRMVAPTTISTTGATLTATNIYASLTAESGAIHWRAIGRWK